MNSKAAPVSRSSYFALALFAACGTAASPAARAGGVPYTVLDLGPADYALADVPGYGTINNAAQVVGTLNFSSVGFRTQAGAPVHLPADDLGRLELYTHSIPYSINASGQVVGRGDGGHSFRTAPNAPINPATDDLGSYNEYGTFAYGINASGQVVGRAGGGSRDTDLYGYIFRTAPNAPINAATDILGLGTAFAINDAGQVVGYDMNTGHAFRTKPNAPINPATDDLGVLAIDPEFQDSAVSVATGINASGRVVGYSGAGIKQAFRTAPNAPINPLTDGLGTLPNLPGDSKAYAINAAGQVVGSVGFSDDFRHGFFVDVDGPMRDLNDLVRPDAGWTIKSATGINDRGQIAASARVTGEGIYGNPHALLLTPARPGDATGDTLIDFNDLVVLAQNYNVADGRQTWWSGDFTGDGNVDFNDLVLLAQGYNTGPSAPGGPPAAFADDLAAAFAEVPEPASAAVMPIALAGAALFGRRSRRSRRTVRRPGNYQPRPARAGRTE